MTDRAAIKATFSDWRPVKTRKVLQLIFEVPLEQTELAMKALGVPQPDQETWCAIALLRPETKPEKPQRHWDQLKPSQQAGIACDDPRFQKWANCPNAEDAAVFVRDVCGVASRAELDVNRDACFVWGKLYADFRQQTGLETEQRS